MQRALTGYRATVLIGWILLSAAGVVLARAKGIPAWAAAAVVAAFLVEFPFYLAPGFAAVRARFRDTWGFALLLAASAFVPYLLCAAGTGALSPAGAAWMAGGVAVIVSWHRVLPRGAAADIGFLALLAGILLARRLDDLYGSVAGEDLKILGQLTLIHLGAICMMAFRGADPAGYGFLPSKSDWKSGTRYFVYFFPIGFPLAWWFGLLRLDTWGSPPWKIVGTFVGILWVVALSEEFFFRGLLQRRLDAAWGEPAATAVASLFFGAVHLGFGTFPNWKLALVAAIAGVFYGLAFRATGSIRTSMVTHAWVVTFWRAILS